MLPTAVPLKMKVLQYSLLSPVDASMDSRGADFSGVGAGRSDAGVVDGIAGGRRLPQPGPYWPLCESSFLFLILTREREVIHMFFIYILKGRQENAYL